MDAPVLSLMDEGADMVTMCGGWGEENELEVEGKVWSKRG